MSNAVFKKKVLSSRERFEALVHGKLGISPQELAKMEDDMLVEKVLQNPIIFECIMESVKRGYLPL